MSKYQFGSIVDRDFRLELQRLANDAAAQGKAIQDLVAEGQLTEEQYAELISVINGHLKSGEVGKFDLKTDLINEIDTIREKITKGNVNINDLSEKVLRELNEANPEFNILSIPKRNSVTPFTTTFLKVSSNLFIKDSAEKSKNSEEER